MSRRRRAAARASRAASQSAEAHLPSVRWLPLPGALCDPIHPHSLLLPRCPSSHARVLWWGWPARKHVRRCHLRAKGGRDGGAALSVASNDGGKVDDALSPRARRDILSAWWLQTKEGASSSLAALSALRLTVIAACACDCFR